MPPAKGAPGEKFAMRLISGVIGVDSVCRPSPLRYLSLTGTSSKPPKGDFCGRAIVGRDDGVLYVLKPADLQTHFGPVGAHALRTTGNLTERSVRVRAWPLGQSHESAPVEVWARAVFFACEVQGSQHLLGGSSFRGGCAFLEQHIDAVKAISLAVTGIPTVFINQEAVMSVDNETLVWVKTRMSKCDW
jgi:hypothetical protein